LKVEIKVPPLSESLASGTLLAWRKQVGEQVLRDETLVDLETDKVIMEIPAAASGTLLEIRQPEGTEVKSDQVIAVIETAGDATRAALVAKQVPKTTDAASSPPRNQAAKKPISPPPTLPSPSAPSPKNLTRAATLPQPPDVTAGNIRREKMSRLRSRIAERLVAAQHTAAMLTTFNEVNMQAVNELRQRYKAEFEIQHGVKLGYMSFFVRAVCVAMQQFPVVNAAIDGDEIVWSSDIDIGIAVSTPRGLVVPILRQAQTKSPAMIETAIADFALRAKEVRLTLADLAGGTFSITNGGVFGSLLSTPILNPPQSAILGMHKIQERPVAENGQVVIRPMMYLALTYDHRLVDGREAVQFLVAVKDALEAPEHLLAVD
jgi:2-oxoglutarate dehydrogenase E2 component (dihydrolipoamide succinyltransferase)